MIVHGFFGYDMISIDEEKVIDVIKFSRDDSLSYRNGLIGNRDKSSAFYCLLENGAGDMSL